jgi:hypothetical protein
MNDNVDFLCVLVEYPWHGHVGDFYQLKLVALDLGCSQLFESSLSLRERSHCRNDFDIPGKERLEDSSLVLRNSHPGDFLYVSSMSAL